MRDERNPSQTMQLKGTLGNQIVHVLIDSGATHNFIHPQVLKVTKLPVRKLKPLNVLLASGAKVKTTGEVTTSFNLQGCDFIKDFYVLPMTGCQVVLGASWLRSLGDILWNFETMKMKFVKDGVLYLTICCKGRLDLRQK